MYIFEDCRTLHLRSKQRCYKVWNRDSWPILRLWKVDQECSIMDETLRYLRTSFEKTLSAYSSFSGNARVIWSSIISLRIPFLALELWSFLSELSVSKSNTISRPSLWRLSRLVLAAGVLNRLYCLHGNLYQQSHQKSHFAIELTTGSWPFFRADLLRRGDAGVPCWD